MDDALKFVVLDEEDLEVVSAHVQDAVVKVADVHWRPREKRLVVAVNRFDWEGAQGAVPEYRRRRAALRFERVLACQCRNVTPGEDAVLNLLAVEFAETDAPAGTVTLIFSGGAALRLQVECLEAELADLGPELDHRLLPGPPRRSRPKTARNGPESAKNPVQNSFFGRICGSTFLICAGRNGLLELFEPGVPLCANSLSRRRCCSRAARCLRHPPRLTTGSAANASISARPPPA